MLAKRTASILGESQDMRQDSVSAIEDVRMDDSKRFSSGISPTITSLIEALLIFVCIILVVVVSISLFAYAKNVSSVSIKQERAIALATDTAERFSADPLSIAGEYVEDDMLVECSVSLSLDNAGSMYIANINVSDLGSAKKPILYSIKTARYISLDGNDKDKDYYAERVLGTNGSLAESEDASASVGESAPASDAKPNSIITVDDLSGVK